MPFVLSFSIKASLELLKQRIMFLTSEEARVSQHLCRTSLKAHSAKKHWASFIFSLTLFFSSFQTQRWFTLLLCLNRNWGENRERNSAWDCVRVRDQKRLNELRGVRWRKSKTHLPSSESQTLWQVTRSLFLRQSMMSRMNTPLTHCTDTVTLLPKAHNQFAIEFKCEWSHSF